MRYRILGKTQIRVSEIGFGAWGIGGMWGTTHDPEAIAALHRAYELGVTFFDTAAVYGDGHSEELIAQALGHAREEIVIASKVPPKNMRWPVLADDPIQETFPADWIVECTEQSLRRLKTDYLDVQQLHAWTPDYVMETDWYDALEALRTEGKIRAYGVSVNDWDAHGGVGLVKAALTDTVEVIYNIFEQRPAQKLFPAAQAGNVGIIARVPFEEGLLTGALTPDTVFEESDWRGKWLTPERLEEAQQRLEPLKAFLNEDRPSLAALALKFCLSHPAVSTVIPGMRTVSHVDANCAASDGKLLAAHLREELAKHAWNHGWAYPWAAERESERSAEGADA